MSRCCVTVLACVTAMVMGIALAAGGGCAAKPDGDLQSMVYAGEHGRARSQLYKRVPKQVQPDKKGDRNYVLERFRLSVATLADQNQLIVQAKVQEVQSAAVTVGQLARVTVPGSNVDLSARVSSLGRTYHGKSSSQPVVVRDLELDFDSVPKGIKPGTAVQVTLLPPKGKA